MPLIGRSKLEKLKAKHKGNQKLVLAINQLIIFLEKGSWKSKEELKAERQDADCVHADGFYFFDLELHRVLVQINFKEIDDKTIVWVGSHQEYEKTFKNNKHTIRNWLISKEYL
jgi:mRNA interferase HigB